VIAAADLLHEDTFAGAVARPSRLLARQRIVEARVAELRRELATRQQRPGLELGTLAAGVGSGVGPTPPRCRARATVALMRARHHGRDFVFTALACWAPWLAAASRARARARAELLRDLRGHVRREQPRRDHPIASGRR
jgi:hypothetical protein